MTLEQFEQARSIYTKIQETNNELLMFKEMVRHGAVGLVADIGFPKNSIYSSTVRDYLSREEVHSEIVSELENKIERLKGELFEL